MLSHLITPGVTAPENTVFIPNIETWKRVVGMPLDVKLETHDVARHAHVHGPTCTCIMSKFSSPAHAVPLCLSNLPVHPTLDNISQFSFPSRSATMPV